MAVKTITANINVVPVGIENAKAKFQELLKSTNISEAMKLDIKNVISKIDEIGPRLQSQLSSKGTLNVNSMGFGQLDKAIFKLAKDLSKELGIAFDTAKVDEFEKRILDVDAKISANQNKININEKDKEIASAKLREGGAGLPPGMKGAENLHLVKERLLKKEQELQDLNDKGGSKETKKYKAIQAEIKKYNKYLDENKTTINRINDLNKKEIKLNEQKAALSNELVDLNRQQQLAIGQSVSELPEMVKTNAAIQEYVDAKNKLIKSAADQAEANAKARQSEVDLDGAQKKTKKSLLEKIFALMTFQKIMQFANRVLRDSIKTIKDLDKAITDMAVVTNMSREEAWKLVGAMQELAKKTGLATSEISGVIVQFVRQGRSMQDAFRLAEVAAKSAKVAGIQASEAVNFLTSAVNGFGLAATQAESIADKFAAIAAKSASSFEELAIAMSKVAPTAKSAGIGVDFMMGVIAKGIETTREAPENIGTAFKTIFARMREVTDLGKAMEDGMSLNRVEKALGSVGVSLRDSVGQFRNLEDVLIEVGRKWNTLTSIEQAYLATALAGSRQQPRLLAIFNNFERTEELIAISASAAGELEDQHLEYMEGLEAAMTKMRNSWEQVVTAFMSSEVIIKIVDFLSGAFSTIADVIGGIGSPIQVTTVALIGLTAALGVYTALKAKATAMEQFANAQGALTATQLIKLKLLRVENAASMTYENAMLALQNKSMTEAIGIYFSSNLAKIKSIIYTLAYGKALMAERGAEVMKNVTLKEAIVQSAIELALKAKKLTLTTIQIIKDKAKLVIDKIALLLLGNMNKGLVFENTVKKKSILLTLKDIVVKAALVVWNGILAAVNWVLNSSFIALAISIAAALFWLLPFIAAGAALIAIGYFLVSAFIEMSKSAADYGKEMAKLNKQSKELENQEDKVKKLAKRFDELNNKVEKTAEDFEEMASIGEELGEVKVGDKTFNIMTEDAFGNAIIDEKEYNRYLAESAKEREKLRKNEEALLRRSVSRFGRSAFNDEATQNSARRMGFRMAESMIEGIEDANIRDDVNKAVQQAMAKTDMSKFVTRGRFDTAALDAYVKKQTQIFSDYYTNLADIQKTEEDAVKNGANKTEARVASINSRIDEYKNAIDEINAMSLTDEQKQELIANVKMTMSGEAGLLELIENRNIDVTIVANMQLRGMDLNQIGEFFRSEIATYQKVADKEIGVNRESTAAKQAELDDLKTKPNTSANRKRIAELEAEIAAENALIEQSNQRTAELTARGQTILGKVFSGENLTADMQEYREFLKNELGLTDAQIEQQMAELYNSLGVKSASAIANAIQSTKTDREALYNLPAEIAKGNFESMIALAEEYGAEAVEAFLSGDPAKIEGFFAEQKEKTLNNIDESIAALEGMRDEQGELTDAQKAELLQLQTMRTYYESMSAADQQRVYWLGKSKKLLEEMNDLLKIAQNLLTLGLDENNPFVQWLENMAQANYTAAVKALETQLSNELESLSQYGTFDENGVFVFNEGADMVAGQAALDGYLETLGEYTNVLVQEYNRQAEIIKKRYQAEIDAIKNANQERWKEIEYLDKLGELESKIMSARRQLMAFSLDSSLGAGQMVDSLEALQKLQQERQKFLEQKMVEEAEKQLQAERDDALKELGEEQLESMNNLIISLNLLNQTITDVQPQNVTTTTETTPNYNFSPVDLYGV
jgi:TP901 family phage tail tape measure protein